MCFPCRITFFITLLLACAALVCINANAWALEGEKIHVDIRGVTDDVLKNVELQLSIQNAAEEQKLGLLESLNFKKTPKRPPLTEADIKRLHRISAKEIRLALQPFGYYSPRIETKLEKTPDGWAAVYTIDPGPPTIVDQVEIRVKGKGAQESGVKEVLNATNVISGQKLEHQAYEQTKNQLFDALYNAGYLDARFIQNEIRVYPQKQKADIFLIADSGPIFHFGPLTVEQDILNQTFVKRYATFKPGEHFDYSKLIDYQLALRDSNYFSEVDILAERKNAIGTRIPVVVKTKATKPRRYNAGIGYGTDTGPRLTAGVEFRRINRRGHKIGFEFLTSTIEQSFNGQYQIPIKNVATDNLTLTASASQIQVGDIDTNQFKFGTSMNQKWLGFRRKLSLTLERENFDIGKGTQTSTLVVPGIQLSRTYADDQVFPRYGYSMYLDVHGGLESPLTETTFLHTSINVRSVFPLTDKGRLLMHGELGAIQSDAFSDLPFAAIFCRWGP